MKKLNTIVGTVFMTFGRIGLREVMQLFLLAGGDGKRWWKLEKRDIKIGNTIWWRKTTVRGGWRKKTGGILAILYDKR